MHKNSSPIERSPVAKLTAGELDLLRKEYSSSAQEKKEASGISIGHKHNEKIVIDGDLHKERRRPSEEELRQFQKEEEEDEEEAEASASEAEADDYSPKDKYSIGHYKSKTHIKDPLDFDN